MYGEWIYHQPAEKFWEGLPLGTGRIASMLYGDTDEIVLSAGEETLWSGCPYEPAPEKHGVRRQIYDALLHGRHGEAEALALSLRGCPTMVQQYRSMGRLRIRTNCPTSRDVPGYVRTLDFMHGVARFACGGLRGTAFASYPRQLVCLRLESDAAMDIDALWETEQPVTGVAADAGAFAVTGGVNDAVFSGRTPYEKVLPSVLKWRFEAKAQAEGADAELVFCPEGRPGFSARQVKALTVYFTCATSWLKLPGQASFITDHDPAAVCAPAMAAAEAGFDNLMREASADLFARMDRFSIRLGDEARTRLDTTWRMDQIKGGETDDAFLAQYLMYGRYILLCGARQGTLAFNNHNIWAEKSTERWQGRWTLNINIQECYWICGPTGLEEEAESLLTFTELLAASGKKTVRALFGLEGWCAHHGTDLWMNTAPQDYATWHSIYPVAGIWLCNQLYDIWLYRQDGDFIERLKPLIYGSVQFALGLLVEYGGVLLTCPSSSPENFFVSPEDSEKRCGVTLGSTHDLALIRQLFRNFLEIFKGDALCSRVRDALQRLPGYRIGKRGELCEWFFDYEEPPEERHHRHISHLYGIYPADEIRSDALKQAVRRTLALRGMDNLGWAGAWRSAVYARLGDGEAALAYQRRGTVGVSLHPSRADSTVTPSFEGNQAIQGWGAALCEMFVRSSPEEIVLLPALPGAFDSFEIRGMGTRCGVRLDFACAGGRLTRLVLHPTRNGSVLLRLPGAEPVHLTVEKDREITVI